MVDDVFLLTGEDYYLTDDIVIRQPTCQEILDYGEQRYFSLISFLTSTPSDLKWQLYDSYKIYFDEIDEFAVFFIICKNIDKNDSKIILGDLDLSALEVGEDSNNQLILFDPKNKKKIFDVKIYNDMVDYIRKMHVLKKNCERPANKHTRDIMIQVAKKEYEENKNKHKSVILPCLLFLSNTADFKYDFISGRKLPIYIFLQSYFQVLHNKDVSNLYNGIYSGAIDIKKINKKELSYIKEFN